MSLSHSFQWAAPHLSPYTVPVIGITVMPIASGQMDYWTSVSGSLHRAECMCALAAHIKLIAMYWMFQFSDEHRSYFKPGAFHSTLVRVWCVAPLSILREINAKSVHPLNSGYHNNHKMNYCNRSKTTAKHYRLPTHSDIITLVPKLNVSSPLREQCSFQPNKKKNQHI